MKLWPRSLFGRLTLLLIAVVGVSLAATILFFRHERAAMAERQFNENRILQLQALRGALESSDPQERSQTIASIEKQYGARVVPDSDRPRVGMPAAGPLLTEMQDRLRESLGPGTELRMSQRQGLMYVRVVAGGAGYWVGFPLEHRPRQDEPSRAIIWSLALTGSLLIAAFIFSGYLARPLRDLNAAVERLGHGESPPTLPEDGPSEIANLNRGFNQMTANLRQLEQDRALLLAGVSHDLRTPLARLRLGVEMDVRDAQRKEAMSEDIAEIDRIIGQFLDFARNDHETAPQSEDPNAVVAACVDRYARGGKDVRFKPGAVARMPLRSTAVSRLVANLIDNALAYGAPPVEVTTTQSQDGVVLEVADRGPGIPEDQVARLKQPFTRLSAARTSAPGVAGAGLGLAIVDRVARLHGGTLDLLARDGGGTIARVTLAAGASGV